MQLQFYIFDLHLFQRMLSLTGAPEQGFPIIATTITSYLAGRAGHGKTGTADFLTCAFWLLINMLVR